MRDALIKTGLFTAALLLTPLTVSAAETGELRSVALTIYNGDLALIREVRELELAAGTQNVILSEVSGQLRPDTVHLSTPGLDVELLEQNYDYDLVDTNKLLERFIGKTITLVDDYNKKSIEGRLLSVSGGIVLESAGQILLNPPGRVVLPAGSADGLLLRPTLSWMLYSPQAARKDAEITYLSGGLNWEADYVVLVDASDKAGDVEGWVTLSNYSGTTYENAELKLVAGDVNRVQEQYGRDRGEMAYPAAEAAPAPGGFAEESFFEYHLYDLQRPTTIKNNQQKQIGLLNAAGVPMQKLFVFDGISGGDVRVEMQFTNDEESGMGMPLPQGVVRVYKEDSEGAAQFVGEDRIEHTPRKEDVRLYIGNAFDIVGETVQTEYKDIGRGYTASYKVTLKNRKTEGEPAIVTVPVKVYGEWKFLNTNYDYVKKDAWTAEFKVPVPADSEKELTFSYELVWR